jgi:RND family efflux transporter MFP subunit
MAAEAGGVSDAALLERFVAKRDEAAFELLVWRHARLVFGVCRRVLPQLQDAEDAFQATFLTLARRADRITRRQAIAGWLYKVAYRVVLSARGHQGTLTGFSDHVNATTGTLRVRGQLPNSDLSLLPGMSVRVRLSFGKPRTALAVPVDAIAKDQDKPYVLVVNSQNVVERRDVQLGPTDNDLRIVEKGLEPGDWVIVRPVAKVFVSPVAEIHAGQTVKPQRKTGAKSSQKK